MTLLTSLLTRDYALAVADRRVTRDGVVVDDERNKAVQVGPMLAFTYTGLAELQGDPTDVWLAKVLMQAAPTVDPFQLVATAAERAISPLRISTAWKRQAFFAVGWVMLNDDSTPSPVAVPISNSLDAEMRWSQNIGTSFKKEVITVPEGAYWLLPRPLGAPVTDAEFQRLGNLIRRCRRHRLSAIGMAYALARFTREIAKKQNTVGRDVVATIVPLPPLTWRPTFFSSPLQESPPDLTRPSCWLMKETERRFHWTMPGFVENGVAFTDTTFEPNDDGWTLTTKVWGRPRSGTAGLAIQAGDELHSIDIGQDGAPQQAVRPIR